MRIQVRGSRVVVASGHLDEVRELAQGGTKLGNDAAGLSEGGRLLLVEATLLGEGAFSRVSEVKEATTGRTFALKRMTKTAALQCPEHVFCEQHISKNTANAFCIRQYASFKVGWSWGWVGWSWGCGAWRTRSSCTAQLDPIMLICHTRAHGIVSEQGLGLALVVVTLCRCGARGLNPPPPPGYSPPVLFV